MIGQRGEKTYVCGAEHPAALGTEFDCNAGEMDVLAGDFLVIVRGLNYS